VTKYIEVIIIDSESSEDSQLELRKLNEMFPTLITHSIGERLSPGQARNLGLEMTTSDYVEVEADTPAKAEMVALKMYEQCEIRPQYPLFMCEEADKLEEDDE
jgi:hypothetical protein